MANPNLTDINDFFETRKNQFERQIFARYWQTNPFSNLVPSMPFDLEMGLVPTVITATHELPTTYQALNLVNVALSTGTGNASCSPSVTNIGGGYINRSYQLQVAAFATETICLTDMQFAYQAEQQARAREKGLADYVTAWMADWHRVMNIGMINTKVSTLNATGLSESDDDTTFGFTNVTLPTVALNWTHLGQMYDQLTRLGAHEFAVGMADGAPVFALNAGPGLKRSLFQTNDFVRTGVNYMDMGHEFNENFKPRGINSAINGMVPNLDPFPIRYDANLNPIYPFVNRSVTQGTQGWKNPAYRTPAVDPVNGKAVYEAFSVMARMIYTRRPRPVGPIQISQQSFNAVTYGGEVRWINNPDMANNQLGNYGFYRVDIQQAAMPEYPELGFTGLTLAVD
jgi:hypothetical protein